MKCTTADEMRELDRRTIEDLGIPGMVLMEVAGRGVADAAEGLVPPGGRYVVIAGPGNNGGDGYVAARHLENRGRRGRVVLLGDPTKVKGDAAKNRALFLSLGGVEQIDDGKAPAAELLADADLVIDAIFGTGLQREVEGRRREVIEAINASGLPAVAVDIPSGLDADKGSVLGVAVQAQRTVTFGFLKRSLVSASGAELAGDVTVVDIGIPPSFADELEVACELVDEEQARSLAPLVSSSDHKGRRGHVLIVAGSSPKAGAAWLAAQGALRAGAGLATIITSPGARARMGAALPEVMAETFSRGKEDLARSDLAALQKLAEGKDALVVGPGLASGQDTARALHELLKGLTVPAVVDAEALNLMAEKPARFKQAGAPLILTPHPGEMARLLDSSVAEVQADRFAAARTCAEQSGQVVLLKGARSLVAHPDGRLAVIPFCCAALGTAGSGDVLCGVIASALARGLDTFEAAILGAYVHGMAGSIAAEHEGGCSALATDIADSAGVVMDDFVAPEA